MESQPIEILLLEDNQGDADLILEMLEEYKPGAYHVTRSTRLAQALENMRDHRFALIISDLWLPDSYGLNTFLTLQKHAAGVPVVVLSGNDDEAAAVEAVARGAQDFLIKGFMDGHQLVRSLRYAVARTVAHQ